MNPEAQRVRDVFVAAVKLPPDRWEAFLAEACAGDDELRRQVSDLLREHQQAGSFLDQPAAHVGATGEFDPVANGAAATVQECPGTTIGPYRLLELIGEGGMGAVWMAEQREPVQRKVALKIIKAGMDTRQVVARFETERQALALMDHPNIAKVLDGGTTAGGRPYFVMELIKGVPITKNCDEHRLTPRERLELFVPVCQAIQHAHQKGIIHRDVKPANVLVAPYDGRPVPKIIDFGVAKATGQRLTERTLFTGFGAVVGTLEYMSPEQAELNNQDIDTRSDIYSLGVLLYELLTGTTPLSRERLKQVAFTEVLRIIREEEPPRPSTRLSESKDTLPAIAAQRHTEPAKLTKLVRGELDWIAMKCLEKERNRRYESANGLAHDIENYLHDEPVRACPPTVGYRLRKFVRRNKVPMVAVGLVLLALVVGITGTTWSLVRAAGALRAEADRAEGERQAKRAALAAFEAEKKAKETAQERGAETGAVLDFVENRVFAAARPENQAGGFRHDVTLREAVEAALPFVEKSFAKHPLIEARLRLTLGASFWYLGESKIAAEQEQIALQIYTKYRGPDHPDTLLSMDSLANSYAALGRHADALPLHEKALAGRIAKLGVDHPDTLRSRHNLANSYSVLGRHAEALKLRQETFALMKAKNGADHPDTLASMDTLANSYGKLGRHADALKLHEQALTMRKARLPAGDPDTLISMNNVASSYYNLGKHADALKLHQETLALRKVKLGPGHPDTLRSMHAVAQSLVKLGREAEAMPFINECLARAPGKVFDQDFIPSLLAFRLLHCVKTNDAAGLRATAEMWEKMVKHVGSDSMYEMACMWSASAMLTQASGKSAKDATADADRAVAWLRKAIAADYKDVRRLREEQVLDILRDRQDFQKLLADLQAGKMEQNK
jgi:serine/threonine protein kinase/tetratricopeptide (TPR) repeat protein